MKTGLRLILLILGCTPTHALWNWFVVFPFVRCSLRLLFLNFDPYDESRSDEFFRDDSIVHIPANGKYKGVESVLEYIRIFGPLSPWFTRALTVENADFGFLDYDRQNDVCQFRVMSTTNHETKEETTSGAVTFNMATMLKLHMSLGGGYITQMDIGLPTGFWSHTLPGIEDSDNTRKTVCEIMTNECAPYLESVPTYEECITALEGMVYDEVDGQGFHRREGNVQSCRVVHAALAKREPEQHCAHISLAPQEDPDGLIKCQEGSGYLLNVTDYFTQEEFELFDQYMIDQGFDPNIGSDYVVPV